MVGGAGLLCAGFVWTGVVVVRCPAPVTAEPVGASSHRLSAVTPGGHFDFGLDPDFDLPRWGPTWLPWRGDAAAGVTVVVVICV